MQSFRSTSLERQIITFDGSSWSLRIFLYKKIVQSNKHSISPALLFYKTALGPHHLQAGTTITPVSNTQQLAHTPVTSNSVPLSHASMPAQPGRPSSMATAAPQKKTSISMIAQQQQHAQPSPARSMSTSNQNQGTTAVTSIGEHVAPPNVSSNASYGTSHVPPVDSSLSNDSVHNSHQSDLMQSLNPLGNKSRTNQVSSS